MHQPKPASKPGLHTTANQHAQHQASQVPVSSTCQRTDIEQHQQHHYQHNEHRAPLRKGVLGNQPKLSVWQMLAVLLIIVAAVGMIAGFHLSVPAISSEQLHLKTSMQQSSHASAGGASGFMRSRTNVPVHNTPQMLFDDAAKVAIEMSKRRFAAAMAEKELAHTKGVNLEWQRYHRFEGSVFAASDTPT